MTDFVRTLHAEFPPESIPARREGYRLEKIPCCYLLKNPDLGHTLKLNESSVLIWNLCTGEVSVGEMLEWLTENYPEAAQNMQRDLFRVLDELNEEGVISFS